MSTSNEKGPAARIGAFGRWFASSWLADAIVNIPFSNDNLTPRDRSDENNATRRIAPTHERSVLAQVTRRRRFPA